MLSNIFIFIFGAGLLLAGYLIFKANNNITAKPAYSVTFLPVITHRAEPLLLGQPISNSLERITKKPFGLKISPGDSPVSPERFSGYHTGVDFETFSEEQNVDVPVYAICDGQLAEKINASGYGGVVVQRCELKNQPITVIYGHIKLPSVIAKPGQQFVRGETIAVLGNGFSKETDGERKHLHLGVHKGAAINIRGYVQSQADLSSWVNAADYLR